MRTLIKKTLRELSPPLVWRAAQALRGSKPRSEYNLFEGNYRSWDEAASRADSWNDALIHQRVREAANQVRQGKIGFERDARPADVVQWAVVAALNRAAAEHAGSLGVLDFGGSLGSLYYQCQRQLASNTRVHWRIVEQPEFARIGRAEFETPELRFFDSIEAAVAEGWQPNAVLVSGALQYQRDPYSTLKELLEVARGYFILDRMPFLPEGLPDRVTIQHVADMHYGRHIRLPQWLLNRERFATAVSQTHEILSDFKSFGPTVHVGDCSVTHRGMIARYRNGVRRGKAE